MENMLLVRPRPPGSVNIGCWLGGDARPKQASFLARKIELRPGKSQENERTTTARSDSVQPGRARL